MSVEMHRPGSPVFSRGGGGLDAANLMELDRAVSDISLAAPRWAARSIKSRIALLDRLLMDCSALAPEWTETGARGKKVFDNPDAVGQEWISGPYVVLRYLRRLRDSLNQIENRGTVLLPGIRRRSEDGRTLVRAFPRDIFDRIFFSGVTAEAVMAPGVAPEDISAHVARAYLDERPSPGASLVLGAGNVSGMGPIDCLYELFLENHTAVLKMSPVNAYMQDVIGRGFRALLEDGFLRIVQGGSQAGSFLCDHPKIDAIRLTGSDKTYEAVVYGTDGQAAERKARKTPLCAKPVRAELGGVTPTIVAPGRWTKREMVWGAGMIATMAYDGGGFSCGATDIVVIPGAWAQRDQFIDALRAALARMPLRPATYPGARERYKAFVESHSGVELFGEATEEALPWAFIRHLDARADAEMCFSQEPFCGVFAEVVMREDDLGRYLSEAVRFANDRLWGTLTAALLVPASVVTDRVAAAGIEKAVADLEYGTVAVNYHPSANWVLGTTPWGGYQAADIDPSESGIGFSQNAMMLSDTEKTVIRAPLGGALPPPAWLAGRGRTACRTFAKLCRFEGRPSFGKVPGIMKSGLGW